MVSRMFASLKNKIKEETGNEIPRRYPIRPRSPRQNDGSFSRDPNDVSSKEKELLARIDQLDREHSQMLEKRERQHTMQLEEKDREWQEKITSLQNSIQAAQAVWSGEAAAARREAREEARRASSLTEQLATATATAARVQDRLDGLMEEIDSERRGWALERIRLATAAEDAIHRLSIAESPALDESDSSETSTKEMALRRKLEEAQLHLHDIKTSWSGQIAALETQVGRLSRQAGEEGAERRRIEKERDGFMEKLREKEIQLEQAQATLEDKEAKDTLTNTLSEAEYRLRMCQDEFNSAKEENVTLKKSLENEQNSNTLHRKNEEQFTVDKKQWCELELKLNDNLKQQKLLLDSTESALEAETRNCQDAVKQADGLKEQLASLQKELSDVHDRYSKERREKDEAIMRNAHMSQTLEIYRQEMRQQDVEVVDMKEQITQLQRNIEQNADEQSTYLNLRDQETQRLAELETLKSEKENAILCEKQMQECIKDLNMQLSEKSKSIRILQNRLTDMRKTLQRELRGGQVDPLGSSVVEGSAEDPDVSKKYLKHVLIKFLTSREIEARQLTKAVGALLGLSEQEETLLRETLSWRNGFSAWLTPPPRFPHS